MTVQIDVTPGITKPLSPEIIDRLMYANYRANRIRFPHVAVERWRLIYVNCTSVTLDDVQAWERKFEQDSHDALDTPDLHGTRDI